MDSRQAVQNLAETIHSLLGLKAHLTSAWVKSVRDIIKNLPPERSSADIPPKNSETGDSLDDKDVAGNAISTLKDELAALTTNMNQLNMERRQVLNEFLDLKGNIRVFCRIRPIRVGENFGHLRPVVALDSNNILLKLHDNKNKSYSFDKVFHPGSSQDEVFSEIEPIIKSVLDGYNACIFAYGQTGTGKTFTMEGTPDSPGIVPRTIEALFKQVVESNHAFIINFSMLEIYLGNLKDLLVSQPIKATDPMPPRNSKLTRVLKDSLGEDSKTLMLVHVSPKEEDLCETICSLNFATRAKSIHLRHRDSNEVRDQKKVSMKNLQQKMKNIEEERQRVKGGIEKLNEKLENLTRPFPPPEVQPPVNQIAAEEPLSNLKVKKDRILDATAAPLPQLPRFMRPTFCSRRKSGMDLHTLEGKDQDLEKRRRTSSHRAESVTFPVKNNSEYNSECSISRSSCLDGLTMKSSADYETDYSQETVEHDVKMLAIGEHYKSQRSTIRQRAPLGYPDKCGNQKKEKFDSTKFSMVDDWLSHKSEPFTSSYTQKSKPVQECPIPQRKCGGRGTSRAVQLCNSVLMKENIDSHCKMKKQFDVEGVEMPVAAVLTEKPQTKLKDLFDEDSRSDLTSASHIIGLQTIGQTQDFEDESLQEDNEFGTLSPPNMCWSTLDENKDIGKLYLMSTMQAVKDDPLCPDRLLKNGQYSSSPPDMENHIFESKGDSGISISISRLESHCQEVSTEIGITDNEKENLEDSSQPSPIRTQTNFFKLRSQKALFIDNGNQKYQNLPYATLQESTNSKGTFHILKQRIQTIFASALLGLGFSDLGLNNDFFHGLMV